MTQHIDAACVISGGGPAGLMCGFLLARAGVEVHVLEKHGDFLRDFRGDTIHPSTLDVIDQLGLGAEFDALPQTHVHELSAEVGDTRIAIADFRMLRRKRDYIAFMPQWDFLNFLSERARAFPCFHLHMETEATGLIEEIGVIRGVRALGPAGEMNFRSQLTIAADGRFSTLRDVSGLDLTEFGAPMDVFWFHLPKPDGHGDEPPARFHAGRILIMLDRGTYWQCGYVIPKGMAERMRAGAFEDTRTELAQRIPSLESAFAMLEGWDDFKLLAVQVNRLEQWSREGFLCIGDAAHAMSPIGGVGINIAIQDAVATANLLASPLKRGALRTSDLEAVQKRRLMPAKLTQSAQLLVQKRIISTVLAEVDDFRAPLVLRLFNWLPFLRRIPARLIGLGVRPERVAN